MTSTNTYAPVAAAVPPQGRDGCQHPRRGSETAAGQPVWQGDGALGQSAISCGDTRACIACIGRSG